jgi:hypothetical protein
MIQHEKLSLGEPIAAYQILSCPTEKHKLVKNGIIIQKKPSKIGSSSESMVAFQIPQ